MLIDDHRAAIQKTAPFIFRANFLIFCHITKRNTLKSALFPYLN